MVALNKEKFIYFINRGKVLDYEYLIGAHYIRIFNWPGLHCLRFPARNPIWTVTGCYRGIGRLAPKTPLSEPQKDLILRICGKQW